MTKSVGEGSAVWIMMVLLLVAAIVSICMSLYVISRFKKQFGYSAMEKMHD